MRLLLILLILLAFPVLEVMLLVELADRFGWWLLGYLLLSAAFGAALIAQERVVVFARIIQTVQEGRHPVRALLTSAKKLVAGILLILPGVISDVVALVLLLIHLPSSPRPAANDDVIEGEWRREE
jgi:UPF0716 protein FxsA